MVRGEDGILRAFYNVCRHRAACVATSWKASRLDRCRYHGWTYDLAGRLRGTPEFDGARLRRGEIGLARSPSYLGALRVRPFGQDTAAVSRLPQSASPSELAPWGWSRPRVLSKAREYRLACNWKVFVDNYLDGGYHINTVHPGLAGVLDYAEYRTRSREHQPAE